MKLPGELFNKLFLKREVAEEDLPESREFLFDQIKKASVQEAPQQPQLDKYDSDLVKMAQIAVFFDVLETFNE